MRDRTALTYDWKRRAGVLMHLVRCCNHFCAFVARLWEQFASSAHCHLAGAMLCFIISDMDHREMNGAFLEISQVSVRSGWTLLGLRAGVSIRSLVLEHLN